MQSVALEGGFQTPAYEAARAFRAVMNAMARPGSIEAITGATPPAPMSVAAGCVLLTLCDGDTSICLLGSYDQKAIRDWIGFHIGAPIAPKESADFVLGGWDDLLPLTAYKQGTPEYPDRSATLIVESDSLAAHGATLRGPGIKETAQFGLPDTAAFQANHRLFPLGLDFLFTSADRIAALPRSTEVL